MSNGNVVDSKVVELELNNQKFESNATTSISTLDKLKKALNFSDSSKNFEDMNKSLHKIDVKSLTSGVGTLKESLNSLRNVVAFAWIADEAIKAKNAVEGFVKSVTIDQVGSGWNKYAEKTSAVQTIMAATAKDFTDQGEQMEYVNGQLEKLNWFTDETSYNFLDMVSNIGKFTANNVKLDEAVTSMQGISNWAAISGANVNEAGRAMYNLSQAIAVGSVKLMDWKSIENANMATAEFKQTAIDTAVELGTLTKESDDLYKTLAGHEVSVSNFNQSLSDGWFTSEALIKTLDNYGAFTNQLYESLEKMSDSMTTSQLLEYVEDYKKGSIDMNEAVRTTGLSASDLKVELEKLGSEEMEFGLKAFRAAQEAKTFQEAVDSVKDAVSTGWMNTFEIMFGDYLQAKTLWTDLANDLYDIFAEGGNARNELLKEAFGHQTAINESDWNKIVESGLASPKYIDAVRRSARMHGVYVDMFASDEEWLQTVLSRGLLTMDDLDNAYNSVFSKQGKKVNEALLEQVKSAKDTDESFQELLGTLEKYSADDVANVIFGDGSYAEGSEELERTLDSLCDKFGISQTEGQELVDVLKELGLFGGSTADEFSKMSDEELKALGWTQENIEAFRKATEEGKNVSDVLDEIRSGHMTGGELWIGALHNGMEALMNTIEAVKESFHDIFPETSASAIFNFLQGLYDYTNNLKESIANSENFRSVLHGIFSVVDLLIRGLGAVGKIASNAFATVMEVFGVNLGDIAGNVGDAITKFRDWVVQNELIEKAVTGVSNAVSKAVTWIKAMIDSFLRIPFISRNITRFKGAFSMAFNTMPAFLDRLSGKFGEFKKHVEELGGFKLGNLPAIFTAFKEDILDYISNWSGLKGVKNAFKNFGTDVGGILSGVKEKIVSALSDWRSSLDDSSLVAKIYDFIVNAINKVKAQLEQLSGGDKSVFSKIFDFIVTGITNIGKFISGINWGTIGRIGFALLPIIAIIKVVKKITGLFKSFGNILGNVETITDGLAGKLKPSKLTEITNLFKSIAILIGVVTACIYVFTTIPPDKLENALWTLLGIVTFLTIFIGAIAVLDKFTGGISKGTTSALVGAAAAIYIVTAALVKLSKIENINDALVSMAIIGALLIAMYAVMAYMNMIGGKAKRGQASTLISMAAAIYVMTMALERLAKIPADQLNGALVSMGIIGALLIAMYAVMAYMNMLGGKSKRGQASSLIATAAAIYLMVMALERIAKIPTERLNQALIVISVLGLVLAGVQVALGHIRKSGGSTSAAQVAGMIASAAALYIMVAALAKIADIPADRLEDAVVMMGVLGIILAGLQAVLGAINSFGGDVSAGQIISMVASAAALYIMAAAMVKLSEIDSDKFADVEGAMLLIGAVLAAVMWVGGMVGSVSPTLLILAALIGVVGIVFYAIAQLPTENVMTATLAIISIFLSLSVLMGVLTLVGMAGGAIDVGIMALLKVIVILGVVTLVAGIIGGLVGLLPESIMNTVITGLDRLITIAGKIGEFLGAIISGFVEESTSVLPQIADTIASFMSKMEGVKPLSTDGITAFGEVLAAVAAIDFVGFFGSILSFANEAINGRSNVEQFAVDLQALADGLTKWQAAMDQIDTITVPEDALSKLTDVMLLIDIEGFVGALSDLATQAVTGKTTMEAFVEDLSLLGDSLVDWQTKMEEIDAITVPTEAIDNLVTALGDISFAGLKQAVQNLIGELISDGDSPIETFSKNLDDLATGLSNWQTKIDGIGEISIDGDGIQELVDGINAVPKESLFSAVKEFFVGAPNFETFGTNIEQLGEGLNKFSTALGTGFDAEAAKGAAAMVSAVSDLGEAFDGAQITDKTGFFGGIKEGILTQLGTAIVDFGGYLKQFSEIEMDTSKLTQMASASESITHVGEVMATMTLSEGEIMDAGLVQQFSTGIDNVKAAIEKLVDLNTSGVDKLGSSIDKIGAMDIQTAAANLGKMGSQEVSSQASGTMNKSGQEMGSALVSGLSSQADAMSGAVNGLVSGAASAVDTSGFSAKGTEIAQNLATGISKSGSLVTEAIRTVVSNAASAARGYYSSFSSAGSYMGAGFSNGIAGSAFRAMLAARAMAVAALEAARSALRVSSPSKEAYEIGNFFGLGFTNAIDDNVGSAYDSGYGMADAARKGLHNAARTVREILSSDFDADPVIRPVLDLSEIQNGASSIGDMLNSSPIPVTGNLAAIRGNVNSRSMASNSDVISAISQLRRTLGSQPSTQNVYNVNGITYDDGSNVSDAVRSLIRAARVERRA